ncbi:MAG: hypothetical protein EOP46_14660, partial [Sphingobacteriaceae bacterium]
MRRQFFAIIILLLHFIPAHANTPKTDSLWQVLKAELKKENTYIQHKEQKILLLKKQLEKTSPKKFTPRFQLLAELFEEYSSFRFDSAITSAHRMIALSKQFNEK